jgi:zinc protease
VKFLVLFLLLVSSVHARLNIQHWMTPEGAKVLFVQTKGLPILDISLNFDAATAQ